MTENDIVVGRHKNRRIHRVVTPTQQIPEEVQIQVLKMLNNPGKYLVTVNAGRPVKIQPVAEDIIQEDEPEQTEDKPEPPKTVRKTSRRRTSSKSA